MYRTILLLAGAGLIGLGFLSGRQPQSEAFWRARQAATDPLELWSVETSPSEAGWAAVRICTDSNLRKGFTHPLPAIGSQQCDPMENDASGEGDRYAVRCTLNGRTFGVSSVTSGDRARDFTVAYSVTDLAGFLAAPDQSGSEAQQTRRYRRLGACPAGWDAGDSSNRFGVKVRQQLVGEAR
jgi:hypothetical protein